MLMIQQLCYFQIAGGCWYVLAIQRIASCLEEECKMNNSCDLISLACSKEMCFNLPWSLNNDGLACNMTSFSPQNVSTCLSGSGSFAYGIYKGALPVISSNSLAVKILYPIFWGLMTLR
jgi:cyclic nucleotide gated channel, plant